MTQDLRRFKLPNNFRGRNAVYVQLWWIVQALLFKNSPQILYSFRRSLLRLFGASIGAGVLIRPTATVTYPWKLRIGDHSWIGDDVVLYSLDDISIGANSVVSQRSYLCGGDHDYSRSDFSIRSRPIFVGDSCWIATDVFIAPGVSIGSGTVVGARSSVFEDMPSNSICLGSPCKAVRPRLFQD